MGLIADERPIGSARHLLNTTDKRRTGNACATPAFGSGGRIRTGDHVVMNDNPILRPVEMVKDGQETTSMFLDGSRTRIFSLFASCSNAVELPSSITEAQRPIQKKGTTDKGRVGNPSVARWCAV